MALSNEDKRRIEEEEKYREKVRNSEKSFVTTLILAIVVGFLGVHRFYVGKTWTGIIQLLTLGGLGIWSFIDIIMIIIQKFTDSKGLLIKP